MSSGTEVISHWSTLIEDFQYSPQKFYEHVAEAVRKRQIPDSTIGKVQFKEGNFLTAKREYLRIHYKKEFYFAICGAPFGTGFFVSWWLLQSPEGCLVSLLSLLPGLSSIGKAFAGPWTYYRADTASMFQTAHALRCDGSRRFFAEFRPKYPSPFRKRTKAHYAGAL
jgi:hypothetical protein